ncbi:MAG: thioredoxin family protein [Acidimicrobiales bacterium]
MDTPQLLLLLGLSLVAAAVAFGLQRRRPEPPTAPSYRAPGQVDRDDFAEPGAPTLVVVFTAVTCGGCAAVWDQVQALASDEVAVQNVEVSADASLHKRYRIDGVPTTLVVGTDGAVSASFFGPVSDDDLTLALLGQS